MSTQTFHIEGNITAEAQSPLPPQNPVKRISLYGEDVKKDCPENMPTIIRNFFGTINAYILTHLTIEGEEYFGEVYYYPDKDKLLFSWQRYSNFDIVRYFTIDIPNSTIEYKQNFKFAIKVQNPWWAGGDRYFTFEVLPNSYVVVPFMLKEEYNV